MAAMKIIIQAPANALFDPGVRVRVGVGSGDPKVIIPVEFNPELGGLFSRPVEMEANYR
jgi:hypothetical protein